jgi:hypothetical protein
MDAEPAWHNRMLRANELALSGLNVFHPFKIKKSTRAIKSAKT